MSLYRSTVVGMLLLVSLSCHTAIRAQDLPSTDSGLSVATFDIDVTPAVGSMMAYDEVVRIGELPLRCRGVIILGAFDPIVLCAFDWIGISNESHDAVRDTLAKAVGTKRSHVAVHTLHQHDAPDSDFLAEKLLRETGVDPGRYLGDLTRQVLVRLDHAARQATTDAQRITHVGFGRAKVNEVASNRRILGPDGKVRIVRFTTARDPAVRAEPEGVIDPEVTLVSFWDEEKPVAVLSYYACHPQSYYRTGIPSPDFPGIARFVRRQAVPEALPIHFNGAGGNIGAGKYNDGNKENRVALALKLADGMKRAWDSTERFPVSSEMVNWQVESVALPIAEHLDKNQLLAAITKASDPSAARAAADKLAWLLRCESGHKIDIGMLSIGDVRVVHMPGELFVEYQLAAKKMRPDLHVSMAAYGDYGPGYIGTERAYGEGGYETSDRASDVSPQVESVLMSSLQKLLEK